MVLAVQKGAEIERMRAVFWLSFPLCPARSINLSMSAAFAVTEMRPIESDSLIFGVYPAETLPLRPLFERFAGGLGRPGVSG